MNLDWIPVVHVTGKLDCCGTEIEFGRFRRTLSLALEYRTGRSSCFISGCERQPFLEDIHPGTRPSLRSLFRTIGGPTGTDRVIHSWLQPLADGCSGQLEEGTQYYSLLGE